MRRIAIIDQNKCKPDKCSKECIRVCPPQKSGKQVIDIVDIEDVYKPKKEVIELRDKKTVAKIFESMCIGCNQCVKRCPFNAIKIINLPQENPEHIVHRYSINGFRLYKLPIIKTNKIIGIIGENGVGKTTLIDILSNKIKPNFELFNRAHSDKEIMNKFRGNVLQSYLTKLYSGRLTFSIKEQKIKKNIPKDSINVKEFLKLKGFDIDLMGILPESYYLLEINKLVDLNLQTLSGGELQRLLCWLTAISNVDVYIFDEPSNFLDIKQRLEIAKLIKSIQAEGRYIILIEHDLSMLDYISDELFIVYGNPGAYGIVSSNLNTLDGINMYLDGYITTDNVRFREEEFDLKTPTEIALTEGLSINTTENEWSYLSHEIEYPNYKLIIPEGKIKLSNSICVILGENGTGKTTFINWLSEKSGLTVSIKKQSININQYKNISGLFPTVLELFHREIKTSYINPSFQSDVIKKLEMEPILSRYIDELSGGELQRVEIVLCLGKQADIYLLDEPSANLDIEKRLNVIKIIKKMVNNNNKSVFIIEHDIVMSVAFSQECNSNILLVKQISYENDVKICSISEPLNFTTGINRFLELLGITMRIGGHNRPRINKLNSQLDREQKTNGNLYGI